jgi:hypothetical protein
MSSGEQTMSNDSDFRPFAYGVIVLGTAAAFAAAVVPHYAAGHRLAADLLFIGLAPYLLYGLFSESLRGWALIIAGVLALGADLALRLPARFLQPESYPADAVYYAPLASAAAVLVLYVLGRRANP